MSLHLSENAQDCLRILIQNHKLIAVAESCTGGLIAKLITDQSGASEVFECGVVSYSGAIKHRLLNVRDETLNSYGEVSAQTAAEMAAGIANLGHADIGVSVTGIAGPTGATATKKVGLIYVGIFYKQHSDVYTLELYDENMTRGDRREFAANFVFEKVIELLK